MTRRRPRPGDEAEPTAGRRARPGRASTTAPSDGSDPRSIRRDLAEIRRQVADLSRMLAANRPGPDLLRRTSAIRSDLRATRRRVLLAHVGQVLEETLPGERHRHTRRDVLELLASYPRGITAGARTSESSKTENRPGGSP